MQKSLPFAGLLIALAVASIALFNLSGDSKANWPQKVAFEEWKVNFGKNYKSEAENVYRFSIFYQNLLMINEHNIKYQAGEVFSQLRLNQFSDLTVEEFTNTYLSEYPSTGDFTCTGPAYNKTTTFNETFYVDKNMLTPVGTQGQCTSGYAFATVASVESSMYKTVKEIVPLSAQQLVDCSQGTGNNGCSGGNPVNALHELINKGAMKASDYPYTTRTDTCKYTAAKKIWEIETCSKADGDISMLKSQILQQPVIVGFDATDSTFIQHGAGLYTPNKCTTTKLNHYMLAVGWGQETTGTTIKTTHYYIWVRNSFGASWGDSGYGKIVIQENKKETGGCGMMTYVFFPYG